MSGHGRPPDPVRIRRDKPVRGDWQKPEGIGWQHGKVPFCPAGMEPATRRAWKAWFASWFAFFWLPEDVPGLRMLAQIYDAVERGDFTRASELRMWLDTYGISPKGQQDRRWQPPSEPTNPARPDSLPRIRVGSVKERFGRPEDD